ncbi:ABC transporter ATP-binding protein [Demequina subtropica]|uniref:ABC transporter ATP-binding protein n=1 Tax=Demequina subtropica TaxID=1638989 RepID=UPI0007852A72|nr:ABC transporter ATP-binding protein [Demequina subtropica]
MSEASPSRPLGPPTVVVDNLHIKYRTFASGKAQSSRTSFATRSRGGTRWVHALKGVSFVAYEGESIGVIGSNGSGKSSLMRAIAGLNPPAEGAVYAASQPAMLGVGSALMPGLAGSKNVMLGALALGLSPRDVREKYDGIVEYAEIGDAIDRPMKTYSSGMKSRLRFSIAMAREHQILLVDEALAVGDKGFRKKSEQSIRDLRDTAGTVFLVSHSMKSIRDTSTRVIWIEKGHLVMDGDPEEVCSAYEASE